MQLIYLPASVTSPLVLLPWNPRSSATAGTPVGNHLLSPSQSLILCPYPWNLNMLIFSLKKKVTSLHPYSIPVNLYLQNKPYSVHLYYLNTLVSMSSIESWACTPDWMHEWVILRGSLWASVFSSREWGNATLLWGAHDQPPLELPITLWWQLLVLTEPWWNYAN